jgi:hypothetical protein
MTCRVLFFRVLDLPCCWASSGLAFSVNRGFSMSLGSLDAARWSRHAAECSLSGWASARLHAPSPVLITGASFPGKEEQGLKANVYLQTGTSVCPRSST